MQICPGHKFMTCQQWLSATPQTYLPTLLPLCHYLDRKNLPKPTVMFSNKRQLLAWVYLSSAAAINQHPPSISKSFPLPLALLLPVEQATLITRSLLSL